MVRTVDSNSYNLFPMIVSSFNSKFSVLHLARLISGAVEFCVGLIGFTVHDDIYHLFQITFSSLIMASLSTVALSPSVSLPFCSPRCIQHQLFFI